MCGSREEDRLGRITGDAGNPAGGYIHGQGSHGILAVQLVAITWGGDDGDGSGEGVGGGGG